MFPEKLYDIVDDSANDHIVSWDPNGDFFMIKNRKEFIDNVLPTYFKHKNFGFFNS